MPRRRICRTTPCSERDMEIRNDIFFGEVERLLAEGGDVTIRVRGNSMRPLLRNGRDSVILRRSGDADIRTGAVMLFRYRGLYCMHRVKGVAGDEVVFAGDGNYRTVERAKRADVVALVRAVVRRDGTTVACDSRRWRFASAAWLALPAILRRYMLGAMRRLCKE